MNTSSRNNYSNLNFENKNNNLNKSGNSFYKSNDLGTHSEAYYRQEPIYRHLNMFFFKLFSQHNYGPEDKFDKNIWFLKNNFEFQKLINLNITPEGSLSEFIKILQECSCSGKSLKNLFIEVKTFVNEISKSLFDAHQRKTNAEEMVKHYKMDEMKELIVDKIAKERQNFNFINDISEIEFSITKLEGFPEGNYNFSLICESFLDTESPFIKTQEITKKILGDRNIIINSYNKDQKLVNSEYFETIDIRNEKNFENLSLQEISLSKSKFCNEVTYIGILLNSFKFIVLKEEVFFATTENDMMIDNFINNLEMLLKDKAFKCSCAAFAQVDVNNLNYVNSNLYNQKLLIHYDLEIKFNKKSKLLLLEKIYNIFYDTITAKYDNEKIINNILDCFNEVSKDVKEIFNEKKNINTEQCACNNCAVF